MQTQFKLLETCSMIVWLLHGNIFWALIVLIIYCQMIYIIGLIHNFLVAELSISTKNWFCFNIWLEIFQTNSFNFFQTIQHQQLNKSRAGIPWINPRLNFRSQCILLITYVLLEPLEKLEKCCRSTDLTVACCWPSNHCVTAQNLCSCRWP